MKLINHLNSALLSLALVGVGAASSPARAEVPTGYQLVFADEFSSSQLDSSKWITSMHFAGNQGGRYHNISYLNYNLDENILFDHGVLNLRADRQLTSGTDPAGLFQYTGSLVSTDGKFDFQYGYVEMRAKYPGGRGVWPVFWLMPTDHRAWPPEFDIAEYYAGSSVMHMGLCHGVVSDPKWDSTGDKESRAEEEFHTYALEWSAGRAVWYQDGVIKKVVEKAYVPDMPMYVILNNGVSSHIGPSGQPNEQTVFPNFFEIDYVRVYQPATKTEEPTRAVAPDVRTTQAAPAPVALPLADLMLR